MCTLGPLPVGQQTLPSPDERETPLRLGRSDCGGQPTGHRWPVRRKVERLLLRGVQSNSASLRGTCRELHEHRVWLWTLLHNEGLEPTRPTFGWCPAGERSLRHAVI